jgi:hypothetical protein
VLTSEGARRELIDKQSDAGGKAQLARSITKKLRGLDALSGARNGVDARSTRS